MGFVDLDIGFERGLSKKKEAEHKVNSLLLISLYSMRLSMYRLFAVVVESNAGLSSQLIGSNHFSQQRMRSVLGVTEFTVQGLSLIHIFFGPVGWRSS